MNSWTSYPHIYTLGHHYIKDLLLDDVTVEEKVDGSQFSFGVFHAENNDRVLRIRSKGAEMIVDAPEKMFTLAVNWCRFNYRLFHPGWTYRAEYLAKSKHNALAYDRVPRNNLILFDVNTGLEEYLSWEEKAREAARLGLEIVPLMYQGKVTNIERLREFLATKSILGGQLVEGVVIKNYFRFLPDNHAMMGKFVSEAYKEMHAKEWKVMNPSGGDIIDRLIQTYHTQARWQKALIHLREQDLIQDAPQDIGVLMKEVWPDIEKEEKEAIKDTLYEWARSKLRRGVTTGLPEWYKEQLLKKQFDDTPVGGHAGVPITRREADMISKDGP